MGVLIVPLLHISQHILKGDLHALLLVFQPAPSGPGFGGGGQKDLDSGIRQHHSADIPAIHQNVLGLGHAALQLQQEGADFRVGTHGRGGHAGLLRADGGAHVLTVQIDMLLPVNAVHPQADLRQQGVDRRIVLRVHALAQGIQADAVLVATGGVSYPTTGSTGDGYRLARQAGHTLVEPVPSLVSLVSHDPDCKKMMGLALKNVTLTLFEDGREIFEEQGEMLFTHFGISGPLTLSASSHLGDMKKHKYHAEIDLKPALSEEQLYDRITRDFALLANHAAQGALVKLLPASMQPVMVARWGIDPATKANQITREQKRELVRLMKHWNVPIDARGDLAHAVITSGGVSVREVDPRTMQSKKALGLYFAGEVLDVDAYTGGYNLQIAFCTAQSFARNLD